MVQEISHFWNVGVSMCFDWEKPGIRIRKLWLEPIVGYASFCGMLIFSIEFPVEVNRIYAFYPKVVKKYKKLYIHVITVVLSTPVYVLNDFYGTYYILPLLSFFGMNLIFPIKTVHSLRGEDIMTYSSM